MTNRTRALRSLFAASAVAVLMAPQVVEAQARSYDLDIPVQALDTALKTLASATGQQVAFRGAVVRGKRSAALKGRFTIEQALAAMLAGSGLAARAVAGGVFVIDAAHTDVVGNGNSVGETQDIVVTGSNIRGGNPESPIITLTRKDIDRSGYSTAADLIKNLPQSSPGGQNATVRGSPFVASGGNYGSISSANLRGLGSDATLTLVDGRRLAYGGTFNGVDISSIPFGAIESVEVLTDGASSIYGSDAIGGVVNIILRKRFDGALTTARTGISTYGDGPEYQVTQLAGVNWSSGGIIGDYEYYQQNPIYSADRSFSSRAYTPNTLVPQQTKNSGFLSVHQEITHDLDFSVNGVYTDRSVRNSTSQSISIQNIESRVRQYGISPQLEWRFDRWMAKFAIDRAQDREDAESDSSYRSFNYFLALHVNTTNTLTNYEIQTSGPVFSLPGGDVQIAVGGGYRTEALYYSIPSSATSLINTSRSIGYGYGEIRFPLVSPDNDLNLVRKLEISASGRYEHYSDFGNNFSPKAGIAYSPFQDLNLRGTWGRSFKAGTLTQIGGYRSLTIYTASGFGISAPPGSVIAVINGGNPSLKPEKAESITGGFDYTPHWASGARLSFTYFNINYQNRIGLPFAIVTTAYNNPLYASYIQKNVTAAQYLSTANQVGNVSNFAGTFDPSQVISIIDQSNNNIYRQHISGIDISGNYEIDAGSGKVSVFGNASFLDIEQANLPTLPETKISGTIYNPSKFRARGGAQYQGELFRGSIVINHIGPELDNSNLYNVISSATNVLVQSHTTLDAQLTFGSIERESALGGFRLSLAVQNLLNTKPPAISYNSGIVSTPGLGYDSANYSAVGRYISVTVAKRW